MRAWWPALVLTGWWLMIAGPVLWHPGSLFEGDTGWLDVPNRLHAAAMLRSGVFPGWTSQVLTGFPLHAEGQTGILYPGFLLYVLIPTAKANDVFVAIHLGLAAVFMFWFLRRLVEHRLPAVLGGMGWLVAVRFQYMIPGVMVTLTWLPLAAWCLWKWSKGETRALWWCSGVNGLVLFAGSPSMALMCFTTQALLLGSLCWTGRQWRTAMVTASTIFILPIGLAAAQILPLFRYFLDSNRFGVDTRQLVPNNLLSGEILIPSLVLIALPAILLSRPRRRPAAWLVLGILGALIATGSALMDLLYLLPVYSWFRWPNEYLWMTGFAGCSLVALSSEVLIDRWQYTRLGIGELILLPFGLLAFFWSAVHLSLRDELSPDEFFVAHRPTALETAAPNYTRIHQIKGAYYGLLEPTLPGGFDSELFPKRMHRNRAFLPANFNLVAGVAGADLISMPKTVSPKSISEISRYNKEALHPKLLRAAAITHLVGPEPLWLYRDGTNVAGDGWRFKSMDPEARVQISPGTGNRISIGISHVSRDQAWTLQLQRLFLPLGKDTDYQISFRARADRPRTLGIGLSRTYAPWDNLGFYRRAHLHSDWQDFNYTARLRENEANSRLHFDLGGEAVDTQIEAVVLRDSRGDLVEAHVPSWGQLLELKSAGSPWIYEMREPPSRGWMVYETTSLTEPEQRLELLVSDRFDPSHQAITETPLELGPTPARDPKVTIVEPRPDRLRIEVETESRGLLVIADLFDQGFSTTIDGRPTPLLRANHAFRGVVVPPGKHLIEMNYRPWQLTLGVLISVCSWIGVLFLSVGRSHS